jgi:hypothetical protein
MNRLAVLLLVPLAAMFALWGCDNSTDNELTDPGGDDVVVTDMTCVGCHTSRDMLEEALGDESGSMVEVAIKSDG